MQTVDLSCLKEKTVLFVDDEPATRVAIYRMLSLRFKQVWLAEDGQEGLALFKEHHPDLVITDIEMPKLNGLRLLEEIKRAHPEEPVVIVTGFADEAREAQGADGILIKPIDRSTLFAELVRLMGNQEA